MEVREYKDSDYEVVSKLLEDVFSVKKINKTSDDNHKELVSVIDEKVVGYILLTRVVDYVTDKIIGKIDYFCVNEEYRNRGIGKILIKRAIDYMKKWNVSYIELTSSRSRVIARNMYEKEGFIIRDSDIFRREII